MPEPRQRPRRHASAEERRAQIVEAALRCFAEKGFHAATMDQLALASGLSKGSLYWHFRSKEEVFLAVFDAFAEASFADWDSLRAEGCDTLGVLAGVTERAFTRVETEGPMLRAWGEFLTHPRARERLGEMYRQARDRLTTSLREDAAHQRVCDLPPESLAAALTAAAEGLLLQAVVDEEFDLRAHWPATLEMIRRGIAR